MVVGRLRAVSRAVWVAEQGLLSRNWWFSTTLFSNGVKAWAPLRTKTPFERLMVFDNPILERSEGMTPLRKRMTQDLRIRNYADSTIEVYTDLVARFARFFGKSPEDLGPEDIRTYQVYLVEERKVSWTILNQTVCALRFLYRTTLDKDWAIRHIPYAKREKKLPVVALAEGGGLPAARRREPEAPHDAHDRVRLRPASVGGCESADP